MPAFKQRAIAMAPGTSKALKVKLSPAARKQLRSVKGGKVTVTADTVGSTIGPATKSSKKVRRGR